MAISCVGSVRRRAWRRRRSLSVVARPSSVQAEKDSPNRYALFPRWATGAGVRLRAWRHQRGRCLWADDDKERTLKRPIGDARQAVDAFLCCDQKSIQVVSSDLLLQACHAIQIFLFGDQVMAPYCSNGSCGFHACLMPADQQGRVGMMLRVIGPGPRQVGCGVAIGAPKQARVIHPNVAADDATAGLTL